MFEARSPRAVAHALLAPGQLGLSRAYVSGELAVDDLDAVLELLRDWRRRRSTPRRGAGCCSAPCGRPGSCARRGAPAVELRPRGKRHSVERDARAVRHHYDVANEFFALFLDASMTYSCAIFEDPSRDDEPLESAQERKLETICRKLALTPGERVLDVGCGWGSFAIHAATRHGARRRRHHAVRAAGRAGARARGGGGRRRPRRDPRRRLPRAGRRALRRDRQHRDGRARRRRAARRVRGGARGAARARRAAAEPRHRAPARRRGRGGRVLRALRLPRRRPDAALARRCSRSSARASSASTSRASARGSSCARAHRLASLGTSSGYAAHYARTVHGRGGSTGTPRGRAAAGVARMASGACRARAAFETGFTSIYQVRCRRS